ncbi:YbdD/YjiX family protein [Microbacterium enclense]|uniref:YbdD/YjiX family protein n=1 Tax=Microbacterium enclense TaxID=993073 RepID=UPI0036DBD153
MTDLDATAPGPLARLAAGAAAAGRGLRWYVTTLMGDRAYDVYVAHHRAHHPDEPPVTERQFWRQRTDEQERNPGARCC